MHKRINQQILIVIIVCTAMLSRNPQLWAQSSSGDGDLEVEDLYDRLDNDEVKKKKTNVQREKKEKTLVNLSDLATLEPFSDIAVIQRKYLPTSGRFEASASAVAGLNNAFFTNLGLIARMAYFFNSKISIEGMYYDLSSSEKDVTKGLKDRAVKTESLVTPESFTGLSLRWTPIYGKMALNNKDIYPFETYFALGAGSTKTELDNAPTIFAGTGQNYAINKSMAFRWDFSVNFYQPKVIIDNQEQSQTQYDLFISMGLSFYFPEAGYR